MKSKTIIFYCLMSSGYFTAVNGQTAENNLNNLNIVSKAPISYRVNESGSKLHGYYKKGYSLTIYGDISAIGYRADCDEDDDWSGANAGGTTQSSNSFESTYKCVFNPHTLFGTVLPGNGKGQNHYDALKKLGAGIGDLTITYQLDKNNKPVDSIIGVVFDRGPHNQPGESSVAASKKFKGGWDNNQFIYIVFPGSAKYVKQIIGVTNDKRTLKRNPTNADFEQAYKLMLNESTAKDRNLMKENLINMLAQIPLVANFDNATPKEKAEGKLKEKNNDRNLNQ